MMDLKMRDSKQTLKMSYRVRNKNSLKYVFLRSIMAVLDTHTPIYEIHHSGLHSKTLNFS